MKKALYIIFGLLFIKTVNGQTTSATEKYCDCERVYLDTSYTGYCAEYFDIRLLPVVSNRPYFKEYFLYVKGKKVDMWYWYHASKSDKIFWNNKEVTKSDSTKLLDGILIFVDKKGRTYAESYYKNGFLLKRVFKNGKDKGNSVSEISEFDYSSFPFKRHVIFKKADGTITLNEYTKFVNGQYVSENTTDITSDNVKETNRIP